MPGAGEIGVDAFLGGFVGAQAIAAALEIGFLDRLAERPMTGAALAAALGRDARGVTILASLLKGEGVVADEGTALRLTEPFSRAFAKKDLLKAKLGFLNIAARDLLDRLPSLLFDLPRFVGEAETFRLFRYDRAATVTPENLAFTRRWVDYTSLLTREEAPAIVSHLPLAGRRSLLDIGGNSGEFSLHLCRAFPSLSATVLDLPAVCAIGEAHVAGEPEASRIRFRPGDMRRDTLPEGHDAISFKSVLHDWPEADAVALLEKAAAAQEPGSILAVSERGRVEVNGAVPFWMAAELVFAPFYRDPGFYGAALARLGYTNIREARADLPVPFFVVVGERPR